MSSLLEQKINDRLTTIKEYELPYAQTEVDNGRRIECSNFIMGQRIERLAAVNAKINALEWVLGEIQGAES